MLAVLSVSANAERNVQFDFQVSQARTIDLSPTTYVQPMIAEVVVDQTKGRIHDTWELSAADMAARSFSDDMSSTLQNLRAYGLFKSSEKHACDLIVAATFDIRMTNAGAVITLFGYPANFANWRTGTQADYEWICIEKGIQNIHPN